MSKMNKAIAAAALAALTLPGAALAHGSDRAAEAHKRSSEREAQKKSHGPKAKAFVVKGVDASGLTVTDGALAGSLTLDPTSANKHARRALDLSKTELRGEDTVSFGEAGDKVHVKYVGLTSTDTLAPTDVVKVIGKVNRDGELNIRKITVKRESAGESDETETQS